MSTATLHLVIATPANVLFDGADVLVLRAEDDSGSFGILPGHADFLTVLTPSALRWRGSDGIERFCVVSEGVLRVAAGREITIACREAILGDSLQVLQAQVKAARVRQRDAVQRARVSQTQLQARAVRQLVRYLHPAGKPDFDRQGSL
jgi:F-type H+-transporting ATPase subunit epsilon